MKNIFILLLFSLFSQILFSQKDNCLIASNDSRIVVAGGSIAEILFFLDQQDKIVALDVTSTFPEQTKDYPSIGYVRGLSTEGILSMNPSLIIGENDMGPPFVVSQLKETDIDFRTIPEEQSVEGVLQKIYCVASILDIEDIAIEKIDIELSSSVTQLNDIVKSKKIEDVKIMLILSMKGSSPIVAGLNTSGHGYIEMLGAKNAFDSFEGWQVVSPESILKENPDFIILPQRDLHKNSDVSKIIDDPVFANINAGKQNNFIFDDGMAILGFSPRTIKSALKSAKKILESLK